MSKRLQVVIENDEFLKLRQASRRAGITISDWVRSLIRQRLHAQSSPPTADLANAFREMTLPSPSIDQMLADIERGRQ